MISRIESILSNRWICFAIIFAICTVVMVDIPLRGIPYGYDVAQHLRFAQAYEDSIRNLVFIPSWSAVDNDGLGSVGIRFYPPLADYFLAVTNLIFNDWFLTLRLHSFFWMFPGCLGTYLWIRQYFSSSSGLLAAGIYAVVPYHLLQIYQFQLYSEFAAASITPFCFWFATRLVTNPRPRDILPFALSVSLLLLTHIPTSLIVLFSLSLFAAVLIDWSKPAKSLQYLAVSAAVSLCASSFFLVRVLTEVNWLKHASPQYSNGFYNFSRHLFPLVFSSGKEYSTWALWVVDIAVLFTFIGLLPLAICTVLIVRKRISFESSTTRRLFLAISLVGFVSVFMVTSGSHLIWEIFPPLQKIQFPWRFLSIGSLVVSVSLPLAVPLLIEKLRGLNRLIVYPLILFFVAVLLFNYTQTIVMAGPLGQEKFEKTMIDVRAEESCECWWPIWASRSALSYPTRVSAGNRAVTIQNWDSDFRSFTVEAGDKVSIVVKTFYYPHWKASVNGESVPVGMDENGAITIPLGQETSTIDLCFKEPFWVKTANWISLFTWILVALFTAVRVRRAAPP